MTGKEGLISASQRMEGPESDIGPTYAPQMEPAKRPLVVMNPWTLQQVRVQNSPAGHF